MFKKLYTIIVMIAIVVILLLQYKIIKDERNKCERYKYHFFQFNNYLDEQNEQIKAQKELISIQQNFISNNVDNKMILEKIGNFEATAYDLSVQSCGKVITDSGRGITATGIDLNDKTIDDIKVVAVDPKIIALGTYLYIKFENAPEYDGIYISGDTGNMVKDNMIDVFIGDFGELVSDEALQFGRKACKVYKIIGGNSDEK